MDHQSIEDVLHDFLVSASGLSPDRVVWSHQRITRVDGVSIVATKRGAVRVGHDAITYETDLSQPQGQEVNRKVEGNREFVLALQAFSPDVTGNNTSTAILERVQTNLSKMSVRESFQEHGVAPFDNSEPQLVPEIDGTEFESRAVMEISFRAVDVVDDRIGYIASVEFEDAGTGSTFVVSSE